MLSARGLSKFFCPPTDLYVMFYTELAVDYENNCIVGRGAVCSHCATEFIQCYDYVFKSMDVRIRCTKGETGCYRPTWTCRRATGTITQRSLQRAE